MEAAMRLLLGTAVQHTLQGTGPVQAIGLCGGPSPHAGTHRSSPSSMRVDEAGALPSGRVVLSRTVWRYYDPLRLPGGRLPLPGLAGYRQALLPEPRRLGATEGLSSSHDNLPTVPRPLRRRVPWHPLQAPRCRPWPSPSEYRLGSLLAACAVILNDAAGFASCCGPVGCPPRTGAVFPRLDPGLSPDAGVLLPGPWASPRAGLTRAGRRELVARLRRRSLLSVVPGARATGRTLLTLV